MLEGLPQEGNSGLSQVPRISNNDLKVDLSQVRVRDETVRASPDGGQGDVWLLPRSQVEEEHLLCLFVFTDILFGNRAITQRNLDYFLDHQQMFEVIKFNLHWEGNAATV